MAKPKKKKALIMQIAAAPLRLPRRWSALGQHGLNIQEFVTKFNAASQEMRGDVCRNYYSYEDRSLISL
jgi:ribosomal protein L11